LVSQRGFIPGARSLNEQDLHENLAYFKVPQAGIESIRAKLDFKIFDEYANISVRFNGRPRNSDPYDQTDSVPDRTMPPFITSLQDWHPNNIRHPKEKEKKGDG
jgi:hypothetical protein